MRKRIVAAAAIVGLTAFAGTATAAASASASLHTLARKPLTVGGTLRAPTGATPVAQQLAHSLTVTLVTGDKVRLDPTPGGLNATPIVTGSAHQTSFVQFGWGGDKYVVPTAAIPYLSSTLDPRLFDVSYLARAGLDDAHSKTVPVQFAASSGTSALPGMRVAATVGGTSAGTMAKAQGKQFSDLLSRQWQKTKKADANSAVSRLPGVGKISLARTAGAPALPEAPSSQQSPQAHANSAGLHFHTVTVNTIDMNGNPGSSVGFVQNVDDAALGTDYVYSSPAPTKYSVPEGTYSFEVSIPTWADDGSSVKTALVVQPQVTVNADTTVTLDARTAKPYQATLQTPPANGQSRVDMFSFSRRAATDGGVVTDFDHIRDMGLWSSSDDGTNTLYASPSSTATTGVLGFTALTGITASDGGSSGQPRYVLAFPSQGQIPSTLTYTVPDASLTPVHSKIYQTRCATCSLPMDMYPMVWVPWDYTGMNLGADVQAGEQTDYWYSSAPDLTSWQTVLDANDDTTRWGPRRTITPGQQVSQTLNNSAVAPGTAAPFVQTPDDFDAISTDPAKIVCGACRQDDNAVVNLQPFGDSDGNVAQESTVDHQSTLKFWRNGTLAVTSASTSAGTLGPSDLALPLLASSTSYKLQWTWTNPRNSAATSDTVWTFTSPLPAVKATPMPSEVCAPDPSRSCSFLPLMFVRYNLPLSYQSQAKADAPFQVAFSVLGEQNAPEPTGIAATLSVSYDGGTTWGPATAASSDGQGGFTSTITHPALSATNGFVSLRVSAHDGAGNTVVQTAIDAYGLTN